MTLLVLGASSGIGAAVAAEFAPGNRLILAGRDSIRLNRAANLCRQRRALAVETLLLDLSADQDAFAASIAALDLTEIESVINVASATSRLRDEAIPIEEFSSLVAADLVRPVELIRKVAAARGTAGLRVVFVSSLLAVVQSPNRVIYGGLKALQEKALERLEAAAPHVRVSVFRIGTVIPTERGSEKADKAAKALRKFFDQETRVKEHGAMGRAVRAVHAVHPSLARVGLWVSRILRPRRDGSKPNAGEVLRTE